MKRSLALRRLPLHLCSALLTAVFLLNSAGAIELPLFQSLDRSLYDLQVRLTAANTVDSRIAIVDIDEKSLAREGHWPWPRDKLARLIRQIFDHYQAQLLGIDMVFAERDDSSALRLLENLLHRRLPGNEAFRASLTALRPSLEYDRLFAESLRNRPVILGFVATSQGTSSRVGALPPPAPVKGTMPPTLDPLIEMNGLTGNLPELQAAALGGGFFDNPLLDEDGIFRRVALLMRDGDKVYESLSLAMFHALLSPAPLELEISRDYGQDIPEAVRIAGTRIPIDEQGGALIPYRGKQGSFPYVSATDALGGAAPVEALRGKIVLMGTTAAGLMDMRATPVQNFYPGVEAHANLLAGMLDQSFKERPAYAQGVEFLLTLAVALALALWVPRLSAAHGTAVALATFILLAGVGVLGWHYGNMALRVGTPMVLLFLLYANQMFFGYFMESRKKKRLAGQFSQYVPAELVEEMSLQESDFGIGGENREMTVLFSDVRGFTTLSERLAPHELSQLMNQFLTPLTRVIHNHKGTIDKYMGDAIMAFWGAPLRDERHAAHAVRAALDMIGTLRDIQEDFQSRGWPPIDIGVGLNSGLMSVGNMGSEFRMAYTVLGDAVNLGSRLEGLTKQYGVPIIVSESTRIAAPEFAFLELDRVRVKGKRESVAIYQPLCRFEELTEPAQRELAHLEQALGAYRRQQWAAAGRLFEKLAAQSPDRLLYRLYLERITHFQEHPPTADWDGVFTFNAK